MISQRNLDILCLGRYPFWKMMVSMPTVVNIIVHKMGTRAAAPLLHKIRKPDLQVQTFAALPVLKERVFTCLPGIPPVCPGAYTTSESIQMVKVYGITVPNVIK